jgi:hypothetical protein
MEALPKSNSHISDAELLRHMQKMRETFQLLAYYGVQMNPEKCNFMNTSNTVCLSASARPLSAYMLFLFPFLV